MAAGRPVPVPVSDTDCEPALSASARLPDRDPSAVGVKVTLIVHECPDATLWPQSFVWLKSPLVVMLVIVKVAMPLFVRVTVLTALGLPKGCGPKSRAPGAS